MHVEEALRLAAFPDVPRQRLALLLLDSAAELILHRDTEFRLAWDLRHQRTMERHVDVRSGGVPDPGDVEALTKRPYLSKRRVQRIEKEFDAKALYLAECGALPEPLTRVLRKLHQYRNEAYHRDTVRSDSLRSAIDLYCYVVCVLMRDLRPRMVGSGGPPSPVLAKYFDGPIPFGAGLDVQSDIAGFLLTQTVPDPTAVAVSLRDHIESRIVGIEEALDFIVDFFEDMRGDASWDREAALRFAQIPLETNTLAMTAKDFRGWKAVVTGDDLASWRAKAAEIDAEGGVIPAFALFADIEDGFEPAETAVLQLASEMDHQIQFEFDELRGK